MATVRMKKGLKYADIFDSPETIAQAKSEGYELVTEVDTNNVKAEEEAVSKPKTASKTKKQ